MAAADIAPLRILSFAGPAILNNAAQPLADLAVLAMVAHAGSGKSTATTNAAALALVAGAVSFGANVFNFVVMVTMSETSRVVGARRWDELPATIRAVYATAVAASVVCAATLYLARDPLFRVFEAPEEVRAAGMVFYEIRLAALPAVFVSRAAGGAVSGLGPRNLRAVAAVNVLQAGTYAAAAWGALFRLKSGLAGVGYAYLGSVSAAALALATLSATTVPDAAGGPVRWWRCGVQKRGGSPSPRSFATVARAYLVSSGNIVVRSLLLQGALFALYILAGRCGQQALAAHLVIAQLWGLCSYVCDGFADVGTSLGGKLLGAGDNAAAAALSRRLLLMGQVVAACVVAALLGGQHQIQRLFTRDAEVVALLQQNWVLLAACQPVAAVVFVTDGLLLAFGPDGFRYVRNVLVTGVALVFGPIVALVELDTTLGLLGLWIAKDALTLWRAVAAVYYIEFREWRQPQKGGQIEDAPLLVNPL